MSDRSLNPRGLNAQVLSDTSGRLAGAWPLSGMTRLQDSLHDSLHGEPSETRVDWSAQGSPLPAAGGPPGVWLHLQASVPVVLQCQRCLQAVAQNLVVDRHFRFVRSAQEAERLDETADEDVLVLSPRLDLHELLEDELILALPLVPRHQGPCPAPLPQPLDALSAPAAAPNPFAALAALRAARKNGQG